jgi:hypothetical protein
VLLPIRCCGMCLVSRCSAMDLCVTVCYEDRLVFLNGTIAVNSDCGKTHCSFFFLLKEVVQYRCVLLNFPGA